MKKGQIKLNINITEIKLDEALKFTKTKTKKLK